MRKGILLAGGTGSRLYPVTLAVNKHLLPVYDKPLIYYSLATLLLSGVREILVISSPDDLPAFRRVLGTGEQWGVRFTYAEQARPAGIAEALLIARDFLDGAPSVLSLGDNILYGATLPATLRRAAANTGATIFGYRVDDPQRYGIVELGDDGRVLSLEEKPSMPRSHLAIPGLYYYDSSAPTFAERLQPSDRGELEITDLNRHYLEAGGLHVEVLGRGTAWLDAGTHDSLLDAGQFIASLERRQGLKVACPEEIAYLYGYISDAALRSLIERAPSRSYGAYLERVLEEGSGHASGATSPVASSQQEASAQ